MSSEKIKEILRSLDIRPTKDKGQNFLLDPSALQAIVDGGKLKGGERIIEIGPGLGVLTKELSHHGNLTVIEIEENFCGYLKENIPDLDIVQEDVRSVDFSEFGEELVVYGNLPYSFSTDIIFHLVAYASNISRAVLLLQKEFAERVAASPGGRDYGVLSINVGLWADAKLGKVVSGQDFYPTAKVDSQVLTLKFLDKPRFDIHDSFTYQQLVRAAFFKRRRKLLNSVMASHIFEKEAFESAVKSIDFDIDRRAETISLEEYVQLANALFSLNS